MKKTILFVGGMEGQSCSRELVLGIESDQDKYRIVEKKYGKNINYEMENRKTGETFQIEIIEIIWQDILNDRKKESITFFKKTLFLLYWTKLNFIGKCLTSKNKAIMLNILVSGVALGSWYVSVTILALKGIEGMSLIGLPRIIGDQLSYIEPSIVLIILAILSGIKIHLNKMVDLLYKVKRYLTEGRIKCLFRRRFLEAMDEVDNQTDELKILSHSMGTILTLDYLVNIHSLSEKDFTFISLGSPVGFLSLRSERIKKDLDRFKVLLADNKQERRWRFIYSKTDWMCPDLPEENMSETMEVLFHKRFEAIDIGGEESFLEQLSGRPHMKYFYDKRVIEEIVLGK